MLYFLYILYKKRKVPPTPPTFFPFRWETQKIWRIGIFNLLYFSHGTKVEVGGWRVGGTFPIYILNKIEMEYLSHYRNNESGR
jgi:hypothetical protein